MARRTDTGDPTPYSDADEATLEAAAEQAWQDWEATAYAEAGQEPTSMYVSAQIEWSGSVDLANDGHRSTRLYGLQLDEFRKATQRAAEAKAGADAARPASSYKAQGWQAQLRQLSATQRGRDAADRAGLAPSRRTYVAWLSGAAAPNEANRDRIAAAYNDVRMFRVNTARDASARANRDVAARLSDAFRESQQAEIRLRNITRMDLEP